MTTPWTAARILDLRRDRRLTQQGLAKALGVCRNTVDSWEHERRRPSLKLQAVLDLFERRKQ